MSLPPPRSRRRRRRAALVLVLAALGLAVLASGASAAPATGEIVLTLKKGAKSNLLREGVGANGKQGGVQRIELPARQIQPGKTTTIRTRATIVLAADGRQAKLRGVVVRAGAKSTALSAELAGKRKVFFRAGGKQRPVADGIDLDGPLTLTGGGAKLLRAALGLDGIRGGQIGAARIAAIVKPAIAVPTPVAPIPDPDPKPQPLVDPYAEQCGLAISQRIAGGAPVASPAPTLASPTAVDGGAIEWGFDAGFRYYVVEVSGGTIVPISPATAPAPPFGTFTFPSSGEYVFNDGADPGDDQAVVDGGGEVVLCNAPHKFRVTLANPTVILDGEDSRLLVDVDTNMTGVHTPAQRVDLATLDLERGTAFYNEEGKSVKWSDIPVTLTAAGSEALNLCAGAPGSCEYEAGDELEALSFSASTASAVAWPFNASCDLGSITMPSPTTTSEWPTLPAAPAALPTLSAAETIAGGAIGWGVRNGLRGTINATGQFNLSGGATRSDPVSMSGEGKFFTWPASSGSYEAGAPGRLILHGTGTVGLCQVQAMQAYGTVLSNPTLVLDGANSRLTFDVSSRYRFSWTSGRVDMASLEIADVVVQSLADTPVAGQETITWTFPDPGADDVLGSGGDDDKDSVNSAVKLAAGGASSLSLLGSGNPASPYKTVGTPLNKVVVSIVVPSS